MSTTLLSIYSSNTNKSGSFRLVDPKNQIESAACKQIQNNSFNISEDILTSWPTLNSNPNNRLISQGNQKVTSLDEQAIMEDLVNSQQLIYHTCKDDKNKCNNEETGIIDVLDSKQYEKENNGTKNYLNKERILISDTNINMKNTKQINQNLKEANKKIEQIIKNEITNIRKKKRKGRIITTNFQSKENDKSLNWMFISKLDQETVPKKKLLSSKKIDRINPRINSKINFKKSKQQGCRNEKKSPLRVILKLSSKERGKHKSKNLRIIIKDES